MILFIYYDRKYPHLPVAVAESVKELARLTGKSETCVASGISHNQSTYARIEVDDEV